MKRNISLLLALALSIGGCSLAPNLQIQTPELPAAKGDTNTTERIVTAEWWKRYQDPSLDALIDEALRNSDDLKLSISNVNTAKALLGLSEAQRYPTLNASASATRQKTSEESLSPMGGMIYNTYGLSATLGYEIDFWGKLKNQENAALSEFTATQAERDTVRITLVSSVAEAYFNLVAIKRQIEITEQSVEAFKEGYEYRLRQHRFGEIDPMTAEQAHTLYANAKLSLEGLKESKSLNENALALLVGRTPKEMGEMGFTTVTELPKPLSIPAGIPSDLLQRRPDIRSAEEMLRAANANIGVAKAAYFPSISLSGNIGLESSELNRLMQNSAGVWGIGPSLNVPLLDFGRIKNQVESTESKKETAQIQYAKSVKNAFKEVYDSLKKIESSNAKITAQEEGRDAYVKLLSLSQMRYDAGYVDYLNVLDAKRGELDAQVNLVGLQVQQLANQITLYKALGGGWQSQAE
ncbi:efflux transporter outer membrane subunit [Sulfuricurvum sp.]|uniref:efflux transporter outer membrane subunit n=2 Tax=Sulfuricurvum sp. TaxID=2025608 RepID=UPI002632DF15|nr:efflux transporter outer membrane subunit [Sulfuricurvum sp.]MDD4884624.1 efflux transporter outer membrane subunit [Sulfuricurvum sp.]